MAEIVNLRRVRKARARTEAASTAAANRALHGQTKATRAASLHTRVLTEKLLDQARLHTPKRHDSSDDL